MKFDKKEAAGQPLPFSAPKNPQWVMLAALLLSYAAGYEYVDRCLGFGVASEYSAWRAGVLVFVALYTVVVELAAWAGDRKPSRTAAAWWCCWLVQSLAMAGWSLHTDDLGFWQVVAWHCTAIYYVLARNDLLAAGRTSCLVLLDGVAGMFAIRQLFAAFPAAVAGTAPLVGQSCGTQRPHAGNRRQYNCCPAAGRCGLRHAGGGG